jgi:hypothetical protein
MHLTVFGTCVDKTAGYCWVADLVCMTVWQNVVWVVKSNCLILVLFSADLWLIDCVPLLQRKSQSTFTNIPPISVSTLALRKLNNGWTVMRLLISFVQVRLQKDVRFHLKVNLGRFNCIHASSVDGDFDDLYAKHYIQWWTTSRKR